MISQKVLLILDFGSQYSQLIARRVRELGVYCQLHPYDYPVEKIIALNPHAIIPSGGPNSVNDADAPRAPEIVFELGCPVLGICYGMQTMAHQLGGKVETGKQAEFGYAELIIDDKTASEDQSLLNGIDQAGKDRIDVWMSHGDHVTKLPPGFKAIAKSAIEIAAMACYDKKLYGVQFHPEVTHTFYGEAMFKRFIYDICKFEPLWTAKEIVPQLIADVREKVGKDKVILGLSGGVDSSVTAALLNEAIGDQLICIFIDSGLLRLNEQAEVLETFKYRPHLTVHYCDYSEKFLTALKGVTDPEQKRKVIGRVFIEAFEEQAKKYGDVKWLAQGTIYSDVIESARACAGGKSHVIKSHHNVGGLPERMQLKLIEPLRELFKDEVKEVGIILGLDTHWLNRHPFPGTGLAVRIIGEVTTEALSRLRKAEAIFMDELHAHGLYASIAQAFAVYLPINSVAVVGDARLYAPIIALRAVHSIDFMTAHWAELPYDFLSKVSNRIVNEVGQISRVVYDVTGKPPATIEWE